MGYLGTRNYTNDWAWRVPSIPQLLIPVLAIPGILSCPESPRWLTAKDRMEEIRQFLVKYHAGGDDSSPLVAFELEEISNTIKMEAQNKKATSYLDMLRMEGNTARSFPSRSGTLIITNHPGLCSER
jgi:hypothetical protein